LENIGKRLKAIRSQKHLSQRELAKRSGVTNGTISMIEQDRVSPSIASLKKVLDGLPMSLADFFTYDLNQPEKRIFYSKDEMPEMGSDDVSYRLVGHMHPQRQISILYETYQPGADTGEEMLSHKGEEGGYIISGRLEVTVNELVKELGAGESYYFESHQPHRFRNISDKPCVLVTANTPPTI